MPIFEYQCIDCEKVTDHFITERPRPAHVPCECGSQAVFKISAPSFSLRMGVDPSGAPTMADKWAKAHVEKLKQEAKKEGRQNELPAQYR